MTKNSIVTLAALLTASVSASAIPAVGSLEVDFREAAWAVNGTQTTKTVGDITAAGRRINLLGNEVAAPLTQSSTDGLGVNSPGVDDSELGVAEILRVTFSNGSGDGLTGTWLTKLFTGEPGLLGPITETGYVKLYVGGNFLMDVAFSGFQTTAQNSLGDVYASFGSALNLSEARFYSSGQLLNGLFVNDYGVAGFEKPASVADGGLTCGLLGAGLLGVGLVSRRKS